MREYTDLDLTVRSVEMALTRHCPLGWRLKKDSRESFGLVYIHNGRVEYIFSDRKVYAEKDDIVYLRAGDQYTSNALGDENLVFTVISFCYSSDSDAALPFQTVNKTVHASRLKEMFRTIEEVRSSQKAGWRFYTKGLVQNLIYELLQDFVSQSEQSDPSLRGIKTAGDYIETHIDGTIQLMELAANSGYSLSHFRKKFRLFYGMSPMEYIIYIRIQKAKDLLRSRLYSIQEIASMCGFENVFYFSRVFKQKTGISPKYY